METTELYGDVKIVRFGPKEAVDDMDRGAVDDIDRGATANLGAGSCLLTETLKALPMELSVSVRARTFMVGAIAGTWVVGDFGMKS